MDVHNAYFHKSKDGERRLLKLRPPFGYNHRRSVYDLKEMGSAVFEDCSSDDETLLDITAGSGSSASPTPSQSLLSTLDTHIHSRRDLLTQSEIYVTIPGYGVQTIPLLLPGSGITDLTTLEQQPARTVVPTSYSSPLPANPTTFARPASPTHRSSTPSISPTATSWSSSTHSSTDSSTSHIDIPSTSQTVASASTPAPNPGTQISFNPTPSVSPVAAIAPSSHTSPTSAIVGGVMGGLLLFVLVIGTFLLYRRIRRRSVVFGGPLTRKFHRTRRSRTMARPNSDREDESPVLHITADAGPDNADSQFLSPMSAVSSLSPAHWDPLRLMRSQPARSVAAPLATSPILHGSFLDEKSLPCPLAAAHVVLNLDLAPPRPVPDLPHSPTTSEAFSLPHHDGAAAAAEISTTATGVTMEISTLCVQMAALEHEVARLREREAGMHDAPSEPPPGYDQA